MLKFIHFDLKRLFANKITLVLLILTPVVTLILFSSTIVPLLFSNRIIDRTSIVVFNQSDDEYLETIFQEVIDTKEVRDVIKVSYVQSEEAGFERLENGKSALFIILPSEMMTNFLYRQPTKMDIWVSPHYEIENSMLLPIIDHVIGMFNRSQLGLDYVLSEMLLFSDREEAYARFNDLMIYIGFHMINRSELYEIHGVSPLGKFLPIEYYISALFALFLAFGTIPIISYNVTDFGSTAFSRGISHFQCQFTFLVTRVITGSIFVFMTTIPMLFVSIFLCGEGSFFGGNLLALFSVTLLSAFTFSTLAALISLLFKGLDEAVWFGFYMVILFSIIGGVIFPPSYLPDWINTIGNYSPIGATMKLTGLALFNFDVTQMYHGLAVLIIFLIGSFTLSILLFQYRIKQ